MRFHHSTRRGRNRPGQYSQGQGGGSRSGARHPTSTSRWTQLGYCRETNIHFNRRLPIEPPANFHQDSTANIEHQSYCATSKSAAHNQTTTINQHQELEQLLELGRMQTEANSIINASSSPDSGASVGLSLDQQQQQQQQQLGAGLDRLALGDQHPSCMVTAPKHQQPHQEAQSKPKVVQASEGQQRQQNGNELTLDMESAREKLVAQVEKHPFWSKKAARRMQLTGLSERRIFLYELVSFCERRDLEWRFEPYRGGLVSSTHFRSAGAAISGSQPSSPADPMAAACRSIRVPLPQLSVSNRDQSQSGDTLIWSSLSGGSDHNNNNVHRQQSTGANSISPISCIKTNQTSTSRNPPVRRSRSSANSPTIAAGTTTSGAALESAGSIERKMPSADYVWSIEAPAHLRPEPFVGQLHSCELPGSSFVKRCHGCQGRGRIKCASCYGVGYEVCISCSGKGTTRNHAALGGGSRVNDRCDGYSSRNATSANGYDDSDLDYRSSGGGGESRNRGNEPGGITGSSGGGGSSSSAWVTESCHFCHGAGQKRCWVCAGKSYNHCQGCLGLGQLRCYLNLNITWTNHRDESILNNSDQIIPKERLRLCSGTMLLAEDAEPQLRALNRAQIDGATSCAEDSNQLHLASKRLLDRHHQSYRHERLIKQVSSSGFFSHQLPVSTSGSWNT